MSKIRDGAVIVVTLEKEPLSTFSISVVDGCFTAITQQSGWNGFNCTVTLSQIDTTNIFERLKELSEE